MNIPIHNSNNEEPSLASLIRPLQVQLAQTTEGWRVDISSLTPCDAMMALAREDMLEDSTILSGGGTSQWVACVHGPVERGDAKAIVREVSESDTPLCADLRMQSIVTSKNGESITAHVRDYDDALTLVATAISQYGSGVFGEFVSPPDLGLVDSLLVKTGFLSIRPIETEIFSTFVDVGISTNGGTNPADSMMIYDIHSDSWHGE
jgi:hypothetical protein